MLFATPEVRLKAIVRCLKGRPILAFLRALVGAFKAVKLSPRKTLVSAGFMGCDNPHG